MTTVVYSHKEKAIGYDSRASDNGIIITDKFVKLHDSGGVKYFFAGKPADLELLVAMYEGGLVSDDIPELEAIIIDEGVPYHIYPDNGAIGKSRLDFDFAIGSGGYWAMSALDFGKDVRGAVKYAFTRDSFSGGKINVVKI